jgi:fatty-acyl-CoA synthase
MMNLAHWPRGVPRSIEPAQTSLCFNLEVSAARYPGKASLVYYGGQINFARLKHEVDRLAGYLQQDLGVAHGDRVALYLQNSPQFFVAFYAILRADAAVVLVNPMNLAEELRHIVADSGAKILIGGQELLANIQPLLGATLQHAVIAAYSDYLPAGTELPVPEVVTAPRLPLPGGCSAWQQALAAGRTPRPHQAGPDDLAVIPYTSGTTGAPKGCIHTHASVMHTIVAPAELSRAPKDSVVLGALPMFHVTGLQYGVNLPVYLGATVVVMTRWDRLAAAQLIQRYRVTSWTAISTMLVDFLNQPGLEHYDLTSLSALNGGGAAMPKAVAERIESMWGLKYVEGYGLSETIAPTHSNPRDRPKEQCLGIPIQDTTAIVVDPETLQPLPAGATGEILVHGPQLFRGYWGKPEATAAAFTEVAGMRFFRTGDLGYVDEEGYFFMVDRLKRMINASGYKVWPSEVETLMYAHPAIQEACVVGTHDAGRGESVKAFVVLRPGQAIEPAELIAWSRTRMAAYKVPREIELVERLPKTATGKVQWRLLQEQENARTRPVAA